VFVIVGFAFKVSAVPFHIWAPDTYEGAPTPVTAFLSVASKAAGFVALIVLVYLAFPHAPNVYRPFFWVMAALTMTVGNVVALRQTNIVPARLLEHQPGWVHPHATRRRRLDPVGRSVAEGDRRLPHHLCGNEPRCIRGGHRGQSQDPQR
jgi:NADH:ubiquinone oxidoreductase subunit 2 (chain N)